VLHQQNRLPGAWWDIFNKPEILAENTMVGRGNKIDVFQEASNIWVEICQTLINF
jgi:hypothetical protein